MDLNVNINVYHHADVDKFLVDLTKLIEGYMGQLRDELKKLESMIADARAAQDAATQRVTTDVANLNVKITDLTQQIAILTQRVAQGEDNPELIQKLQDLEAQLAILKQGTDAIDPTSPTILTDPLSV